MDDAPSPANPGRSRGGLCVYTRFWPTAGTGLYAQKLVEALVDDGEAVTFVCPATANPAIEQVRPGLTRLRPPRERIDETAPSRGPVWSALRMMATARDLLRARARCRTYIVSIPDPLVFTLPMLALLRLTGARIILVAHDPVPHAWRFSERWRPVEQSALALLYRLASAIVVLSGASRDKLVTTFGLTAKPIEIIEHGVFAMGDPSPAPGAGHLLAFGTIRRNKRMVEAIDGVIEAARHGHRIRLVIAGEPDLGDPDYADACSAAAAGVPDLIEIRSRYIGDAELQGLLTDSDALLMPYGEFFSQSGVAILAASNARPIIATRAGGIATLIDEGMAAVEIAPPAGGAEIANAIASFYATPIANWNDRARAYRVLMLQQRSWPAIASRFRSLAARLNGIVAGHNDVAAIGPGG